MGQLLKESMEWLAEQPDTLFIGQAVGCPGTGMSGDFDGIPAERRIEFPVAEELQLGIAIGLSLAGCVPVCVFPRYNFLLRAMDQLVNHLDRLPLYSGYRPRVIVRTAVGSRLPLDPGPQHQDDLTDALRLMLRTVRVQKFAGVETYKDAYEFGGSVVVVD